jgi:S-DNA-T family DNA segregation ATPase FtsK/SpoIIIE
VVDFVGTDDPQFAGELLQLKTKDELEAEGGGNFQSRDELYETAVDIVVRERRGSVSLLQRALGIGYGRAARLIDFMAEDGVVGQYNGAQAREVLISLEEWESRDQQRDANNEAATAGIRGAIAGQRSAVADWAPPEGWSSSAGRPSSRAAEVGDEPACERRAAAIATGHAPRRNKITPAEDELEVEYDADAAAEEDDEEWDDEEEDLEDESEEESFEEEELEDDEADEGEVLEDEESEEDDEEEWEENDSDEEEEWEEEPVTEKKVARGRSR